MIYSSFIIFLTIRKAIFVSLSGCLCLIIKLFLLLKIDVSIEMFRNISKIVIAEIQYKVNTKTCEKINISVLSCVILRMLF